MSKFGINQKIQLLCQYVIKISLFDFYYFYKKKTNLVIMKKYLLQISSLFFLSLSLGYAQSWEELHQKGKQAEAQAAYNSSVHFLEQSLALVHTRFGKEHINYAQVLEDLATTYHKMEEYSKAETLYEESLPIKEALFGKNHPEYGRSQSQLAFIYQLRGLYPKAEQLYLDANKVITKENDPELYTQNIDNLVELYIITGHDDKADAFFFTEKGVSIEKNKEEYIQALGHLAQLYQEMGQYTKVVDLYLKARNLIRHALGKEHTTYLATLNNLATLFQDMGQHGEADKVLAELKSLQN